MLCPRRLILVESVYGEEKSPAISKLELLLTELSRSYFVFALIYYKFHRSNHSPVWHFNCDELNFVPVCPPFIFLWSLDFSVASVSFGVDSWAHCGTLLPNHDFNCIPNFTREFDHNNNSSCIFHGGPR